MKIKLFLTAVAVTFSFAMMSCSGNKTANSTSETGVADTVKVVEAAVCTQADSCCQKTDSCAASCDKKVDCDKTNCDKKADCTEKKECCTKK